MSYFQAQNIQRRSLSKARWHNLTPQIIKATSFKGKGVNPVLSATIALTDEMLKESRHLSNWREAGIRKNVLNEFEKEMLKRSAFKVLDSPAAQFLHSQISLHESDAPRGRFLKKK